MCPSAPRVCSEPVGQKPVLSLSLDGIDNKSASNRWQAIIMIIMIMTIMSISVLTHWGRVMHICVIKQTSIGSDNGLSPSRRQAIIWTNAGILLIGPWGTNLSKISINFIDENAFEDVVWKMAAILPGLNVLSHVCFRWTWYAYDITCYQKSWLFITAPPYES